MYAGHRGSLHHGRNRNRRPAANNPAGPRRPAMYSAVLLADCVLRAVSGLSGPLWHTTAQVDAFEGGKGCGGSAAHWQTLGKADNATQCADMCAGGAGLVFAWHHPPECMCHCSSVQRSWQASHNIRVDSGCRGQGCVPPGSPPPPGLPPSSLPRWVGPYPDPTLPRHDIQQLQGTRRVTIYNSSTSDGKPNPDGLYNHGPMLLYIQPKLLVDASMHDHWIACWYNGPQREAHSNRVVFAVAPPSAESWSRPIELFPSVNGHGEENEPFAIINSRLYGTASDVLLGNAHDSGLQGGLLMRRIYSGSKLGPIFWASNAVPPNINASFRFPLFSEMDPTTARDAAQYLDSLVNETVKHGNSNIGPGTVAFNERSMYALPVSSQNSRLSTDTRTSHDLVMLLRYSGAKVSDEHTQAHLWAARCTLPSTSSAQVPYQSQGGTFSCRSGTGAYDYEIPSSVAQRQASWQMRHVRARQCNWSTPVETNLPDAPSRTCAGLLPNKMGIGLVGNQGGVGVNATTPRDPLTFITSEDGLRYNKHWVVDSGAPIPKWKWGYRGFQYPSFTWCTDGCQPLSSAKRNVSGLIDVIVFSYSMSKEDIVLSIAPLSSIQ